MALVVKTWRADATEQDEDGNFVVIECRQEGIIGFILHAMGMAPTTTLKVGSERIEFTAASLAGYSRRLIPLQGVCSSYYGFARPIREAAVIAAISIFFGGSLVSVLGPGGALLALLGIGGAIVYYMLNKKLTLGFVENSGVVSGIQVKRSVIEGRKIEDEDAQRVCQIVQNAIEARAL